jgi:sensor histidine kinase regulating citrate/malate metabolism
MKTFARRQHGADIRKATNFGMAVNAMEIAAMALLLILVLYGNHLTVTGGTRVLVFAAALAVIVGEIFGMITARSTQHVMEQMDAMSESLEAMEKLNNTLRAQRHDFLNHLQVVYSLIEMEEYQEANRYIDKVYGSITSVSRVLKTASPAINALLQVKLAACEKQGIRVTLNINSAWKNLPMPAWEMCKVLSNLIDNAMDAMEDMPQEKRHLVLTLTEDVRSYRFSVANTGPEIPEEMRPRIFEAGVTTKSDGHGMGLYIVRNTLRHSGGDIALTQEDGMIVFAGYVPKALEGT